MPKMSHAIEGWPVSSLSCSPARVSPTQVSRPAGFAGPPGLWRYERASRSRLALVLGVLISAGLHVGVLTGFNHRPPPVRAVPGEEAPLIQMTMPDLEDDEEKPVETLEDEAPSSPAVSVPMLADVPTIVPVDAFVQPLDFTPSVQVDPNAVRLSAIPVNIARGSGGAEKLGKIFDISQLDRQPQAIFQPPPVFPVELRRDYSACTVVVGFIISTKGEVVSPYVISSEVGRFEQAALSGVLKWKFKPGYRGGRAVNTRTQISIHFTVTDAE